jgi:hypothetical protein
LETFPLTFFPTIDFYGTNREGRDHDGLDELEKIKDIGRGTWF